MNVITFCPVCDMQRMVDFDSDIYSYYCEICDTIFHKMYYDRFGNLSKSGIKKLNRESDIWNFIKRVQYYD